MYCIKTVLKADAIYVTFFILTRFFVCFLTLMIVFVFLLNFFKMNFTICV